MYAEIMADEFNKNRDKSKSSQQKRGVSEGSEKGTGSELNLLKYKT